MDILLVIVVVVAVGVFLQGLVRIPVDPLHSVLVTVFGEPTKTVKRAGWRFFFLRGIVFDYIPVDVTAKNSRREDGKDMISPQSVRTPDNAELEIDLQITLKPDDENGETLFKYIEMGKESEIWRILRGIAEQKLRVLFRSTTEGPQTGEAALGVGDDAVAVLVKSISGNALPRIPSNIPTLILLHYFQEPRPKVLPEEEEIAGKNWERLDDEMSRLTKQSLLKLRRAVKKRREVISSLKNGNGEVKITHLGIILTKLNIANILAKGDFAKALELKATEVQERKPEVFEMETELIKAKILKKSVEKAGGKISFEEAFQIIMEWKATREGHGFAFPSSRRGGGEIPVLDLAKVWLTKQLQLTQKGGGKDGI